MATSMNIRSPRSFYGFTLIEVMIALAIFAVLSLAAFTSLDAFVRTRDAVEKKTFELAKIQKAMWVISNDMEHMVGRNVRDTYGDWVYALITDHEAYDVVFTRTGWRNPLYKNRSELQRVAYQVGQYEDGKDKFGDESQQLLRYYWRVLDQGNDAEPKVQVLIEDINDFEIQFLGQYAEDAGEWHEKWPIEQGDKDFNILFPEGRMPTAVRVRIDTETWGEFQRVFQLSDLVSKPDKDNE